MFHDTALQHARRPRTLFSVVRHDTRGVSLVEIIIVVAIIGFVFAGLFAGMQLMVNIIFTSKAEAGARSLAIERMEYIRSLPYDNVGTVAGIPAGNIPQTSTTTLNGIEYVERVLIQYLDRPEDGFGGADTNTITEDSKIVKIEYTWDIRGVTKTTTLISDIIPRGIESTAGGGTLLINVFDAATQPVAGADVHVYNNTGTTTVDVTVTTNANGVANFPGAPAGGGYEITVTKPGYSTDQTYSASTSNPNPNPPHVAVVASYVSTVNFAIDVLSDLTVRTISTPTKSVFSDSFSSSAQVAASSSVVIGSGEVVLAGGSGSYSTTGTLFSTETNPVTITNWESFDFNGTTTVSSSFYVQLFDVSGSGTSTSYALVDDADLTNNSLGFVQGPIDITALDTGTHDRLALGATLLSSSTSQTPIIYDWALTYVQNETPVSGIDVSVASSKNIGDNGGTPVLKYTTNGATDGSGELALVDLEWDAYDIVIDGASEGYDIKEAYAPLPYALSPNVTDVLTVVLEPYSTYSLRTTVTDTLGNAIGGADVRLQDGGYDQTQETSIYGQTYFSGLASSSSYTLTVSANGYDTDSQTDLAIIGTTENTIVLAPAGSGGGGTTTPPVISTYLAGYTTRIPISIAGTSLFGDVTNFPVYTDLSDLPASFFSAVQSGGGDIRITSDDGLTEVPYELVAIDTGAQTGELYFKAPSLSTATTSVFYMYYGSSTAPTYGTGDTYGRDNVWTNNYLAVYHFENAAAGTGGSNVYIDATGNGYDGDDYVTNTGKTGKLGQGQTFNDGTSDRIALPHTLLDGRTDVTTAFWYRTDQNQYMSIVSGAHSGGSSDDANEFLLWFQDRNDIQFFTHGSPRVNFDISSINDNVWRQYVAIRNDSSNQMSLYINGVGDNENPESRTMSALDIDAGGLFLGVDQDSVGGSFGQWIDGDLDEMRFSDVVRSDSWISNSYSNQTSPGTFYTVGSVETE